MGNVRKVPLVDETSLPAEVEYYMAEEGTTTLLANPNSDERTSLLGGRRSSGGGGGGGVGSSLRLRGARRHSYIPSVIIEEVGETARSIADETARRRLSASNALRASRRRSRPSSVWEAESDELRATDPDPLRPLLPLTEAAHVLRGAAIDLEEYVPVGDTAAETARLLGERQRLVKESDFTMAEKRAIVAEERLHKQAAERQMTALETVRFRAESGLRGITTGVYGSFFGLQLWTSRLHRIEGSFGTAVLSYYVLMRWVVVLNALTTMLLLAFLVVPQAVAGPGLLPETFAPQNLLLGDGYLASSLLFIGSYNETGSGADAGAAFNYNIPLAYILVMGAYFFLVTYSLLRSIAFQRDRGAHKEHTRYSLCVLTSWDYAISSQLAQRRKQMGITRTIVELLAEDKAAAAVVATTHAELLRRLFVRLLVNVVSAGILGGVLYGVYVLVETYLTSDSPLLSLSPALSLSVANAIVPTVFDRLAVLEGWASMRTNLQLTLARCYILRIAGIYVLLVGVYQQSQEVGCWETAFGQEVYRLLITDTLVQIVATPLGDGLRNLWSRGCGCGSGKSTSTFSVALNVLSCIYRQALVWTGVFFSPLLPLVGMITSYLIVLIKDACMHAFLVPPSRVFRASTSK